MLIGFLLIVMTTCSEELHFSVTKPVAPLGIFIGAAKQDGVWGEATSNFSLTTPSTLAIDATNAPLIE